MISDKIKHRCRGSSVELLVVIGVMAALILFLIPSVSRWEEHSRARKAAVLASKSTSQPVSRPTSQPALQSITPPSQSDGPPSPTMDLQLLLLGLTAALAVIAWSYKRFMAHQLMRLELLIVEVLSDGRRLTRSELGS